MTYGNSTPDVSSSVLSEDRKAIGLVLIAMFAFSAQDAMVKLILVEASVWQSQLIRSLAVLVILAAVAVGIGKARLLWPVNLLWPTLRALFMCSAYILFYASLPFLTLSQASATFFVGPLIITLLAALVLREPIGPKRIFAIVVGFIGVMCIVRPDGDMNLAALLPIGAAISYASGVIITRWRCRADPAFSLSMVHNVIYALVALVIVVFLEMWPTSQPFRADYPVLAIGWADLTALIWILLIGTAVTHTIGMLSSTIAYQSADASRIAPFEYSYLAFAPLWDIFIWGAYPDRMTVLGIALIAGSGGFVAWREGRPARARPQNYGEIPWSDDSTTPIPKTEDV